MTTTFPVLSSVADEAALGRWAQEAYCLPTPVTCRFERRSMSDAYRVESGSGAYYLKVYSPGRHDAAAIDAQMRLLLDLRARGISVVEPIATAEGEYATPLPMPEGPRHAALFRALRSHAVDEDNPAHAAAFGYVLGQVHEAGDKAKERLARWELDERHLIHEPVELLAASMNHRPDDVTFLREIGAELANELAALLPRQAPCYGLCHGDTHAGNALFDAHGRPVQFDFDSFGYGWRALDVGGFVVSYDWMDLSAEMKRKKERILGALLDGYTRVRSLGESELTAIELSEPIRHLDLLGLGIRYAAQRDGIGWLDDDFIDAHVGYLRRWRDEYRSL